MKFSCFNIFKEYLIFQYNSLDVQKSKVYGVLSPRNIYLSIWDMSPNIICIQELEHQNSSVLVVINQVFKMISRVLKKFSYLLASIFTVCVSIKSILHQDWAKIHTININRWIGSVYWSFTIIANKNRVQHSILSQTKSECRWPVFIGYRVEKSFRGFKNQWFILSKSYSPQPSLVHPAPVTSLFSI
jgi:hypothetical protein